MRRLLALCMFCFWTLPACSAEAGYQEGVHYKRVSVEQLADDQIEVIEFFSYTCPHCAVFAPYIKQWDKKKPSNVKVTYIPVVFQEKLMNYARAHYALEILGVAEKAHLRMFEALHVKNQPLDTPEQIAALVTDLGISEKQLIETMNSFTVDNRVRQSMQRTRQYQVSSVPMVAVNGKYITNGGMAGTLEEMLKIMDHLVRLESKPKAANKSTETPKL